MILKWISKLPDWSLLTILARMSPFATVNEEKLYNAAKEALGTHLTLDKNVPAELGCAEAISTLLKRIDVQRIPLTGFEGTNAMYQWMSTDSQFHIIPTYELGCIIVSPSRIVNGEIVTHGHIGINAKFGILSNDSDNGLFAEKFTVDTWAGYYQDTLGLTTYFFRLL